MGDGTHPFQDFHRVVLDPSRLGQELAVLQLMVSNDIALVVEDEEPRARSALVDRSDEIWHPAVRSSCPVQIRVRSGRGALADRPHRP